MTELHPPRPSPAAVVAAYESIVRYNYSPNPDFRFPRSGELRGYTVDTIADVADEDNSYEVRFEVMDCAWDMGFYCHLPPDVDEDYEILRDKADDELQPFIDAMLERLRAEVASRPFPPPDPDTAPSFDECEAAGVDGTLCSM